MKRPKLLRVSKRRPKVRRVTELLEAWRQSLKFLKLFIRRLVLCRVLHVSLECERMVMTMVTRNNPNVAINEGIS